MATASMEIQIEGSTRPERVRMLVMETDQTLTSTSRRKGTFGQIFHDLFAQAGKQHDPPLEIETVMKFIVESEGGKIPQPEDVDGINAVLLTGSKYDAHGDDEWILKLVDWIRIVWKQYPPQASDTQCDNSLSHCSVIHPKANIKPPPDMRFSGVCFGHQVLCRALGSAVEPSPGEEWELSHTRINLTPLGERLFQTREKIFLHQMHVDHVANPPSVESSKGLIEDDTSIAVWGSSDKIPIQGVYIRERLFTSQGHLGYDERMVKEHVDTRYDRGLISDELQVEEAKEKADLDHDGIKVAAAILRFFHGDNKDIA